MKALPIRFSEQVKKASCDESIEYTIAPLSNRIQSYIQTNTITYDQDTDGKWRADSDGAGAAYDTVGFGLISISGLEDFDLKFSKVKMGKQMVKRVSDECLDRLPSELFQELWLEINSTTKLMQDEAKGLGFTQPSSAEKTSTIAEDAPEMRNDAHTDALMDLQSAEVSSTESIEPTPSSDAPGSE